MPWVCWPRWGMMHKGCGSFASGACSYPTTGEYALDTKKAAFQSAAFFMSMAGVFGVASYRLVKQVSVLLTKLDGADGCDG